MKSNSRDNGGSMEQELLQQPKLEAVKLEAVKLEASD
jgi:hypothetical protein